MFTSRMAGIVLAGLATIAAFPAHAQEVATLALRGGERPSGELLDMNARGFILRIDGQERTFSVSDVAAIEFVVGALPGDAQARVNAGHPIVLLRNGQVVEGRLADVGGMRPLRLTVDTPSGSREFMSSDVAQVHLGPLSRVAPAQTQQGTGADLQIPAGAATFTIPANQQWVDTAITVARGTRLQFVARGDVMISPTASSGPGGSPAVTVPGAPYPMPGAPAGALLGRVGTGTPFLIGVNTQPIAMPNTGRLMLGVNDDTYGDNSGAYTIGITRLGR